MSSRLVPLSISSSSSSSSASFFTHSISRISLYWQKFLSSTINRPYSYHSLPLSSSSPNHQDREHEHHASSFMQSNKGKAVKVFLCMLLMYILYSSYILWGWGIATIYISFHPIPSLSTSSSSSFSPSSSLLSSLPSICSTASSYGFFPYRFHSSHSPSSSNWYYKEKISTWKESQQGELSLTINDNMDNNGPLPIPSAQSTCCPLGINTIIPIFAPLSSPSSPSFLPIMDIVSTEQACNGVIKRQYQLDELCGDKGGQIREKIVEMVSGNPKENNNNNVAVEWWNDEKKMGILADIYLNHNENLDRSVTSSSSNSNCHFAERFSYDANNHLPFSPSTHPSLYYDTSICLKFAREFDYHLSHPPCPQNVTKLPSPPPPTLHSLSLLSGDRIPFHIYWNTPSFNNALLILIRSFLNTQNLLHTQLIIWVPMDSQTEGKGEWTQDKIMELTRKTREERVKALLSLDDKMKYYLQNDTYFGTKTTRDENPPEVRNAPYSLPSYCVNREPECHSIDIRPFLFSSLLPLTPLEKSKTPSRYQWSAIHDAQAYLEGDLFRLLALYHFGGIYIDGDTLLLKDMEPLLGKNTEFIYPWVSYCNDFNGAIMKFKQRSPILDIMFGVMDNMVQGPTKNSYDYDRVLYGKTYDHVMSQQGAEGEKQKSLLWNTLPPCFFNPSWVSSSVNGVFWKGFLFPNQFNGPFAFHLHGEVWTAAKKLKKRSHGETVMLTSEEKENEMPSDFEIVANLMEWKYNKKTNEMINKLKK